MENCTDNRLKIIAKAKQDLLESTNIETSHEEMAVLDNILFRCWQIGWLDKYDVGEQKRDFNSRCPFCDGELAIRKWIGFDGESFSLKCNTDGCVLNVDSFREKEELINKANTRKQIQEIVKKLEEENYTKDGGELFLNQNLEDCIPLRRVYEIIKEEYEIHE